MTSVEAVVVWALVAETRRFLDLGATVSDGLALLGLFLLLAPMSYLIGALAFVYLKLGRTKTWLDDNHLVRQGILWRKRVDLHEARLELRHEHDKDVARVTLVATDPRSNRSIALNLKQEMRTLPATELIALARAIDDDGQARLAAAGVAQEIVGLVAPAASPDVLS